MLYNILSALRFMPCLSMSRVKKSFFKKGHFIHLRVCNLIFGERVFYE